MRFANPSTLCLRLVRGNKKRLISMSRYSRLVRSACKYQAARSIIVAVSSSAKSFSNQTNFVVNPNHIQIRTMSKFGTMKQHPLSDTLVSVLNIEKHLLFSILKETCKVFDVTGMANDAGVKVEQI